MSLNNNHDILAYYLYCVAESAGEGALPSIVGIDGNLVHTIIYRDILILVHDCKPQPYNSQNNQQTVEWVLRHEEIIEKASQAYANVLPFAFNTIVKSSQNQLTATDNILQWLEERYTDLKNKLEKIRGKKEYIVQVFMDSRAVASDLMVSDMELKTLQDEVAASSKGKAFFLKEKINAMVKQKMAQQADVLFNDFHESISRVVGGYRMEKINPAEKEQLMLMNLSCLADTDECCALGEVLDKINSQAVIKVHFSGPWPPYSFV